MHALTSVTAFAPRARLAASLSRTSPSKSASARFIWRRSRKRTGVPSARRSIFAASFAPTRAFSGLDPEAVVAGVQRRGSARQPTPRPRSARAVARTPSRSARDRRAAILIWIAGHRSPCCWLLSWSITKSRCTAPRRWSSRRPRPARRRASFLQCPFSRRPGAAASPPPCPSPSAASGVSARASTAPTASPSPCPSPSITPEQIAALGARSLAFVLAALLGSG